MKPQQRQLFDYLRLKRAGDVASEQEILTQTGWARTTLATYRSKHYTDPFLARTRAGTYRILRNGSEISERDIEIAFTQVRPGVFTPTAGMKLNGSAGVYELKTKLGNGAVAHVWRCTVEHTGVQMAAKVMSPNQELLNPLVIGNVRERFLREAKYGQRLSHDYIVPYRDLGEIEGQPFLIMDLAEKSLASVLSNGPISLPKSLEVICNCLSALEYLHGLNCKHRDIKPANILQLGPRFVLGDLGIVTWSDMNPAFTSAETITRASLQLGSWYYMAPEQREQPHKVVPASDIYALGVTWYEMLTLKTPDPASVAAKRFTSATTDRMADELIRSMLAYDWTERPLIPALLEKIEKLRIELLPPGQLI